MMELLKIYPYMPVPLTTAVKSFTVVALGGYHERSAEAEGHCVEVVPSKVTRKAEEYEVIMTLAMITRQTREMAVSRRVW